MTGQAGARQATQRRHEMERVTQRLREEHKELIPRIETLRTLADSVGEAPMEAAAKARHG